MKNLIILTIILFTVQFLTPISAQTEQKPELVVQIGHFYSVNSVSFSADGKLLASGCDDDTIKLWDVKKGKELRTITGQRSIHTVSLSPNGKIVASSSSTVIKLWNTENGEEINSLTGHNSIIDALSFSPNGKILASGSWDNTVKLWDIETGKELKTLKGHTFAVNSIIF